MLADGGIVELRSSVEQSTEGDIMAGRPKKRAALQAEQAELLADLEQMGISFECPSIVRSTGEVCGKQARPGKTRCFGHQIDEPGVAGLKSSVEVLKEIRDFITQDMLPKAIQTMGEILEDPMAANGDKIRVGFGLMDRAGMPAGAALTLDANVNVRPPAELLAAALDNVRARLEQGGDLEPRQVFSEVVSSEPDDDEQPSSAETG